MKITSFQFYFIAMGSARSPMAHFCNTFALRAVTKAETLVFRLRAVPKKLRTMLHIAEIFLKSFICD
jgi:hypothetical protein